jgi:poly(A) RNA polymerase
MSKLLWSLSSIDNRIAPLVFSIRRWAREASITQSTPGPWFSNFQMTLLVLFYLQSIGILPKLNYINEQSVTTPSSAQDTTLPNGLYLE